MLNKKFTKKSLYWLINFLLLLLGQTIARNDIEDIRKLSTYFFIAGIIMFTVKVSAILLKFLKERKNSNQ